jgi:antitoxin (DNA-binding transcriptional repressor) of toxin-antitoxin stability system
LDLLDQVAKDGEVITILKQGRPVAQLIPLTEPDTEFAQQSLRGTVTYSGDVVAPALRPEDWEAELGLLD